MDLELVEHAVEVALAYVPHVIGGIVILVVGWLVAGIAARWARRGLIRVERVDPTLRNFLVSLLRYAILIFTGLAVLNAFGVQTASLIALFGAAGLAIGLALQGTLSNVAAGTMLLLLRPFKVGDYIDAGAAAGTVLEHGLFTTELATPDNVQVIVPNTALWGTTLKNYSYHPTRRQDLTSASATATTSCARSRRSTRSSPPTRASTPSPRPRCWSTSSPTARST